MNSRVPIAALALLVLVGPAPVGADAHVERRPADGNATHGAPTGPERVGAGETPEGLRTLVGYLDEIVGEYTGSGPQWAFEFDGVPMMLFADDAAGRMRVIAPITSAGSLSKDEMLAMLEANFERALDAKYSVWRGGVWSSYVHPLNPLSRDQFTSALWQVAALHHTYGSSYSSTEVLFDGGLDRR